MTGRNSWDASDAVQVWHRLMRFTCLEPEERFGFVIVRVSSEAGEAEVARLLREEAGVFVFWPWGISVVLAAFPRPTAGGVCGKGEA